MFNEGESQPIEGEITHILDRYMRGEVEANDIIKFLRAKSPEYIKFAFTDIDRRKKDLAESGIDPDGFDMEELEILEEAMLYANMHLKNKNILDDGFDQRDLE
jgi:hypothetical protein